MKYILTQKMQKLLAPYEGKNKLNIFNSSSNWFVLWFWLSKKEAIELWVIQEIADNPLHNFCKWNSIIPDNWIQLNLTQEQYKDFEELMIWQWRSEYWVWSTDVKSFLISRNI
jgi:hypothetical protein